MEPKTVIAIEIASSKIKGAAASVGADGRLSVLAVEEIPGTNNVRHGRIQNIREVSGAVNEIVRRLEESPLVAPRKIEALSVSLGGRSLSAQSASSKLKSPHECEITENHVQRLEYEASRDFMGDKRNIEATVPRMFYVNNAAVRKAVGTFGETLRGEFMLVTCGKETRQNLDRLKFDTIDHDNVDYIIRPLAIGELVLSPDERELGCALVDFGAETTTVAVYKDGTLAFLSTIPMGSRLITLDLMAGLGITEEAAENLKLTLGTMGESEAESDNPDAAEISGYIRARAGEIAANILNQTELSGVALSKIVLTGGGSRLPEFATQLGTLCKLPVRVAEMPSDITFRVAGRNNPSNIDIVALLDYAARHNDGDYLSPVPVAQPERAAAAAPAEEEEEEDLYTRPVRPDVNTSRRPVREDDENLLKDDEDEQDEDEQPRARRGFFGLGRKKKDSGKDEKEKDEFDVFKHEEEDPFETYTDEYADDPDEDNEGEGDDDNYEKTRNIINKLGNSFVKLFKSEVPEEEDED